MPNFLFLYRGGREAYEKMLPDEREAMMERWRAWLSEGLKQGSMRDSGDGLKRERRVVDSKRVVTDGPYAETKEVIGGFSLVEAESLDAAADLAKGSPVLLVGGTVEVGALEGFKIKK
jgi:hypothetical protein